MSNRPGGRIDRRIQPFACRSRRAEFVPEGPPSRFIRERRFILEVLYGRYGGGGSVSTFRSNDGMGYRGWPCRSGRRRRRSEAVKRRSADLREARICQPAFHGNG